MILTGLARLGRDAEVRFTPGGDAVANLSLAYNHGRKGEDGKRPTQWISASLWGERAQKLEQYLTKGALINVVIEDVHIKTYERRDGAGTGFDLSGRVASLEFAGGKREESSAPDQPERQPANTQRTAPAKDQKQAGRVAGGFDQMDDDIPFINIGRGISGHAI